MSAHDVDDSIFLAHEVGMRVRIGFVHPMQHPSSLTRPHAARRAHASDGSLGAPGGHATSFGTATEHGRPLQLASRSTQRPSSR